MDRFDRQRQSDGGAAGSCRAWKAYAEAPNEDRAARAVFVKLADDAIQSDDYAARQRITALLIEHKRPDKQILRFGPRSRRSY